QPAQPWSSTLVDYLNLLLLDSKEASGPEEQREPKQTLGLAVDLFNGKCPFELQGLLDGLRRRWGVDDWNLRIAVLQVMVRLLRTPVMERTAAIFAAESIGALLKVIGQPFSR